MTVTITPSEIIGVLRDRAASAPDDACITEGDRRWSNAELAGSTSSLTARLRTMGVARGSVVAVMLPNSIEIVSTMFAAWSLGAALTPVNPALTDEEVRHQLTDSGAVVVVGDARAGSLAHAGGARWIDAADLRVDASADPQVEAGVATGGDIALVIYTSGTTGRPKGVMLDHANLAAMCSALVGHFGLGPADVSLLVLPLFHVNGLMVSVVSPLVSGGSVVIAPRFSPESFWDLVRTHRPTYFSAVPTIYGLLEAQPAPRPEHTSSLRFAICGAAPAPEGLLPRFEERLGIPVVEGYGLSEATVASTINPLAGPRVPGTVGVVLPGVEIAIVDAEGTPQPAGERGEIVQRGPTVMRGYLGRPDETGEVIRDGWLHTGDVGILDEHGHLRIVDRLKDLILRGGENIYPHEVEDCLHRHPAVADAAVVAGPHERYGEVPIAFVAVRAGHCVTGEDLRAHCAAHLARYKVPAAFHLRERLPTNSVGKLAKVEMRRMAHRSDA